MALRKRIGKIGISFSLALAVMAGGAVFSTPTKIYADESALPSYYQLDISSLEVGNQGLSSLCWAYSASKVLETYIYNNFQPYETMSLNISEKWMSLAYMYYVNDTDNSAKWVTDDYAKDNFDYQYGETGMPFFFERVVNTYGIMLEEDFDYEGEVTSGNLQTIFNNYKSKIKTDIIEDLEFSWIGAYPGVKTVVNGKPTYTKDAVINAIKTYISSDVLAKSALYTGVVGVSGQGTESPYVWHDTSSSLSHAMTIIGYNDNQVVTIEGEGTKTGAFILLNSYGEENKIVYMPYDMFEPNLQQQGGGISELNNVLSNTFYISDGKQITQSGNEGTGGGEQAGDGENAGTGESSGGAGTVPEGGSGGSEGTPPEGEGEETLPEETLSFWETIMAKSTEEKVFMGVAVGVVAIFLFVGIGFLIAAGMRRRQTKSINQQVLAHNFAKYQSHRLNLEKQKKELDEELQKIREEQKRKKQRRLKRQFNKNLNTGGSSGNNDNINL